MNELPFYRAVYMSYYNDGGWTAPINITPQIQSDGDQFVSSISYDGTRLYLTKEDAFNSDIYATDFKNGKWTKSVPVAGQNINTKYWESHASISRDGKTMYFTSNRKNGFGEMDIYKSILQPDGQWGMPVNLGLGINTPLNEDTPFITENDSMLYFSSQGHENMGGYDIFRCRLDASGHWSAAENVRYPINTTDDDLFYYPWHNARVVYASLIRPDGHGKEDIYAIQPVADKSLADLIDDILKPAKEPEVPALVQKETGETVPPPAQPVTPPPPPPPPPPPAEPIPSPAPSVQPQMESPKEIILKPVYFAFDYYQLTDEGQEQLKQVYKLMKDYPSIHVRLLGHADAKGPAAYNLVLSEKRATIALQFLVNQGIESGRLTAVGIGEKNFVAINTNPNGTDNPDGRKLNRRVEYEITDSDDMVIKIKMPPVPDHLKFRE